MLSFLGCIVFGHAIYEKAINPYVGLTAKAVLIDVDSPFMEAASRDQLAMLDHRVAALFEPPCAIDTPQKLHPFPILGMPDYYPGNDVSDFYDNRGYFRQRRQAASVENL